MYNYLDICKAYLLFDILLCIILNAKLKLLLLLDIKLGDAEFSFLVIGHEFEQYPKQRIRDIKDWDWLLDEPRKDSDDDEVLEEKGKRGMMKKRKKAEGNEDDNWTGESEDDKELIAKVRKVQRPNYSTRSKDRGNPQKDARYGKHLVQRNSIRGKEEDYEDEETLGGFIVDTDEVEPEEENDEGEEESDMDEEEENEDDD